MANVNPDPAADVAHVINQDPAADVAHVINQELATDVAHVINQDPAADVAHVVNQEPAHVNQDRVMNKAQAARSSDEDGDLSGLQPIVQRHVNGNRSPGRVDKIIIPGRAVDGAARAPHVARRRTKDIAQDNHIRYNDIIDRVEPLLDILTILIEDAENNVYIKYLIKSYNVMFYSSCTTACWTSNLFNV